MKKKQIEIADVSSHFKEGMTIMIGGFLAEGTPHRLIQALIDSGTKDLTIIANDTSYADRGIGRLVLNNQVKKVIVTHIGTNPEVGKRMMEGSLEVELVPQGTLTERLRCAGSGLGGVLTPTGVGTIVEEGKQKMTIEGIEYLLELPLKADLALINAQTGDHKGNLVYQYTASNFNPIMALAADTVIVEVANIVEVGDIEPNQVTTPAALVDYIVYPEGK